MGRVRAALFVDFDNVFSGLLNLDPEVAVQFAEDPGSWLGRLSRSLTVEGPRRWLVLRCYMNPAGSVPHPDPASGVARLYFSRFRPFFTRAGFEVVDCPPLTYTKNAGDIRMVVDALDALAAGTVYDEFVIASGDSDMTPLLMRLRRADRRTTIMSPSDTAEALTSVADRLVHSQHLLALVQGEPFDLDEDPDGDGAALLRDPGPAGDAQFDPDSGDVAFARFRDFVTDRYGQAPGPLNLASLAQEVRNQVGAAGDGGDWFGSGGFVRALRQLNLPGARFSQHFLWDEGRHDPPATGGRVGLPAPVARLAELLGLPRLPRESWWPLYRTLADYAAGHERFNLTDCTRWCRDRLAERGTDVSRNAVGFVLRGISHGGCPLYRRPPPTAREVGSAFVDNVLHRAGTQAVELGEQDTELVREWLAGAEPPEQ